MLFFFIFGITTETTATAVIMNIWMCCRWMQKEDSRYRRCHCRRTSTTWFVDASVFSYFSFNFRFFSWRLIFTDSQLILPKSNYHKYCRWTTTAPVSSSATFSVVSDLLIVLLFSNSTKKEAHLGSKQEKSDKKKKRKRQ